MNFLAAKVASVLLLILILLGFGTGLGAWLAVRHYRPLLDEASAESVTAKAARDNLKALASEQGRKIGDLSKLAEDRKKAADQVVARADEQSRLDLEAANRIQQESIAGDQCAAADTVINQELRL